MYLNKMEELVALSQLPDNLNRAREYLEGRSISLFPDVGYCPAFRDGSLVVSDSLVIPIYTPSRELCLMDTRPLRGGKNSYNKVQLYDSINIPVYNMKGVTEWKIVLEGALNAECLNQIPGQQIPSVATLTASFNSKTMHYLAASVTKGLLIAVDNDDAGVSVAKKALEFYSTYYPELRVQILDYPYGDVNEFLIKRGPKVFNQHMKNQIAMSIL